MCFYFCNVLFFLVLVFNSNSEAKVKYLKDNPETIVRLKENLIHNSFLCKDLEDKLVIIEDIEYLGFDDEVHNDGVIITILPVAENVINIFKELKKIKFPIYGITPFKDFEIEEPLFGNSKIKYKDDYNQTSAYMCRGIVNNESKKSIHAYGLAIDINPLQNPYLHINQETKKIDDIWPVDGFRNLNSEVDRPGKEKVKGKITKQVIEIFKKNGFDIWGGYWDFPLDYHHFQTSKDCAENLAKLNIEEGRKYFKEYIKIVNKIIK